MDNNKDKELAAKKEEGAVEKDILEEIEVEDLTVDGICGVY